jgi:MFS family permease
MRHNRQAVTQRAKNFNPWLGWFSVSLFGIFQFVLQGSIGILAPGLKESFQVDATAISILSSSFFYSYILMQVPVGMFYDNFKIRTVAAAALSVVALACLLTALSPSIGFAIAARILMGLGCSFGFIGVLFCTKQWFSPSQFAFISGVAECFSMAGTGLANLALSQIAQSFGWRIAVAVSSVAAIMLALSIWALLTSAHSYSYPGKETETPVASSKRTRLVKSMRVVLATKEMWLGGIFSACTFSVMSAFVALWGVPFLMEMYHIDVVGATSALAMVYLGIGASSPLLGWLASRVSMRILMTLGTALCFFTLLFVIYVEGLPLWFLYVLMFLLGFTCSVYQLSFTLVCHAVPDYCQGVAIGTTNMITMISAPVLQPIIGILLSLSHGGILDGFENYTLGTYQKALTVLPVVFALGFVIALLVKDQKKSG